MPLGSEDFKWNVQFSTGISKKNGQSINIPGTFLLLVTYIYFIENQQNCEAYFI